MTRRSFKDEYDEFDYHARRSTPRIFGLSIMAVLGILVIIALVGAITFAWAPWKGAREQRLQTQGSGSYRIAAYDKFFDLCASIQATEDQIANVKSIVPNEAMSKEQKSAILLALRNQRNSAIREYNADARKEDTRGHFRASDLPYSIDPTQETTTCAA